MNIKFEKSVLMFGEVESNDLIEGSFCIQKPDTNRYKIKTKKYKIMSVSSDDVSKKDIIIDNDGFSFKFKAKKTRNTKRDGDTYIVFRCDIKTVDEFVSVLLYVRYKIKTAEKKYFKHKLYDFGEVGFGDNLFCEFVADCGVKPKKTRGKRFSCGKPTLIVDVEENIVRVHTIAIDSRYRRNVMCTFIVEMEDGRKEVLGIKFSVK